MDEIRQIWKRKKFVLAVTLLSMIIGVAVNFAKYDKYRIVGNIGFEKYNKKTLSDRSSFEAIFFKGLNLKYRLKIEELDYRDKDKLVYVRMKTGDPESVAKRLYEIGGVNVGDEILKRKITLQDRIFYTVLFSLSVLVMASIFVLIFFKEEQEKEKPVQ